MYASMLPSLLNMKTENLTNSGYDDDLLFEENLVLQMMGELTTKVFRIIGYWATFIGLLIELINCIISWNLSWIYIYLNWSIEAIIALYCLSILALREI